MQVDLCITMFVYIFWYISYYSLKFFQSSSIFDCNYVNFVDLYLKADVNKDWCP